MVVSLILVINLLHPYIDQDTKRLITLEKDLHAALERDELSLHYQPQIDLQTMEVTSVEALLRWHHAKLGLISPLEFIPIAEEQDLIIDFCEWIFERAFTDYLAWDVNDKVKITVNVAPRKLLSFYFVKRLSEQINQIKIPWKFQRNIDRSKNNMTVGSSPNLNANC